VTAQPAEQAIPVDGQNSVNDALTPDRTAVGGSSRAKERRSRRSRGEVENPDYAAFAARIIRAHGRRIADGDIDALPDLLRLAAELDTATQHAVNGLRAFGYSWGDIAGRLGTTRQASQQRWGR
jgi:hypothetical protein